jgi:integrase
VWATPEEAAELLQVARQNKQAPHLVDFIELGLNTGMRKMEMLACRLGQVILEAR